MPLLPIQEQTLLRPLNRSRVAKRQQAGVTLNYLEAWDVKAHLTRIFGFGGWSADLIEPPRLMFEVEKGNNLVVGYLATMRLTIFGIGPNGENVTFTEAVVGSNTGKLPDCHDTAIKTAESDALKRCAINLGTQFGLSLYNNGSLEDVVKGTLVSSETGEIEEVAVTPSEHPEEVKSGGETQPPADDAGAAEWVERLREVMNAGDVPGVVAIKSEMTSAGVLDLVFEGKTLAKMADLAVVHAGRKQA